MNSEFCIGDFVSEREGARKFGLVTAILPWESVAHRGVETHAKVLWRDGTLKLYPILFLEAAKENY